MSNMNDGAVFAPYEAEAEEDAEELKRIEEGGLSLVSFNYAVLLGRDENGPFYMTADGNATQNLDGAATFDAWHEAERFMLANSAFTDYPPPMRRGYERPAFPRVCYVRTYEEITVC